MPIATLGQVKYKLGIASSDTSRDTDLELILRAAEGRVLDLTGYALVAESRTDQFENVREGSIVLTTRRPIDTAIAVVAQGRELGSAASWITLDADVVDAARGRVRIAGASIGFGWPPVRNFPLTRAFRWRATEWPLVRVVSTTAVAAIPDDLSDIAATLTALWDRAGIGLGVVSATAGDVSETYGNGTASLIVPPILSARLFPYVRGLAKASR